MRPCILAVAAAIGCSQPTPQDAAEARAGTQERTAARPDTIADIIQARVPPAKAGDAGWQYAQRVAADMDGDGADETVVLISDVALDRGGAPLWEDGHRWQVYVEESDGTVTRIYARFLPNGRLTASLASPPIGTRPFLVLLEQTPDHIGVYEFRYGGPNSVESWERLDRALSGPPFTGAIAP